MPVEYPPDFARALARLGYSSLTDLFIGHPTLHLWTAAPLLSDESCHFAPVHVERGLRAECESRDDFHFFARVALFTALYSQDERGWSSQDYLLAGHLGGILGESASEHGRVCWRHLQSLNLPDGWKPTSIFDPVLEAALNCGFPVHHLPTK